MALLSLTGLHVGLYVVIETEDPGPLVKTPVEPFLVSLPMAKSNQ